jgi:hypothetical protein
MHRHSRRCRPRQPRQRQLDSHPSDRMAAREHSCPRLRSMSRRRLRRCRPRPAPRPRWLSLPLMAAGAGRRRSWHRSASASASALAPWCPRSRPLCPGLCWNMLHTAPRARTTPTFRLESLQPPPRHHGADFCTWRLGLRKSNHSITYGTAVSHVKARTTQRSEASGQAAHGRFGVASVLEVVLQSQTIAGLTCKSLRALRSVAPLSVASTFLDLKLRFRARHAFVVRWRHATVCGLNKTRAKRYQ